MTLVDHQTTSAWDVRRPALHLASLSFRIGDTNTQPLGWALTHPYIETFWLPIIGPTSTLLLRFAGRHVTSESYKPFDPAEIAVCLGVSPGTGRNSPIAKTITRLTYFDLVAIDSPEGDPNLRATIASSVPEVPQRKQQKWPEYLRILHSRAVARQHIDAGKEQSR